MTKAKFDQPIVWASLAEMVARRILDMVTAGLLKPGDQLPPERELAVSLNVSRPSVREAIRGLTILGVVRSRQGGGSFISELDAQALLGPIRFYLSLENSSIRELYDARGLIESGVARQAAVNMSDKELAALEKIYVDQKKTLIDSNAFRASDSAFHMAIWTGSGNGFLRRIGQSLNEIGLDFRMRASETSGVLEQSYSDHKKLLDALKARDPDAAAEAAASHMKNVYESTVAQINKTKKLK